MSYIYSAGGKKIALELSADDIGVRFGAADQATVALRAMRASEPWGNDHAFPRSFDKVVLLHRSGAARSSFATVRDALSRDAFSSVRRTLPVFKEPDSGLRMVVTREITVRFKPRTNTRQRGRLLKDQRLEVIRENAFVRRQFILEPQTGIDETVILDIANRLSECDEVEYATPNFVSEHRRTLVPDAPSPAEVTPLLPQQWHLQNLGANGATAGEDIKAFGAWAITGGDPDVIIAILDDGVDIDHPDLQPNIWTNPAAAAPDRHGRNFYNDDYDPRPRYFTVPYDSLAGNDIHGTPCAGVAAACRRNGVGVAGLAYQCRILPVKIFGADSLASNERVANAIRYAGSIAQVISCSWTTAANADLESAVSDVVGGGRKGKGCVFFCATGNDSAAKIGYPARYDQALAIGACNDQGQRSSYSNYGKGISYVAPSSDDNRPGITTTDVSTPDRGFSPESAYTDNFGGTSSATPLAAGVAALMLSVKPTLTRDQVFAILRDTADKIDVKGGEYRRGYSIFYGYGRLNAHKAVLKAQGGASPARASDIRREKKKGPTATKPSKRKPSATGLKKNPSSVGPRKKPSTRPPKAAKPRTQKPQ